jgi:hypothetical protein
MTRTAVVKTDLLNEILITLRSLKGDIADLRIKLEAIPLYGSQEWWDFSVEKALKDKDNSDYKEYSSVDNYIKDLDSRE